MVASTIDTQRASLYKGLTTTQVVYTRNIIATKYIMIYKGYNAFTHVHEGGASLTEVVLEATYLRGDCPQAIERIQLVRYIQVLLKPNPI